MWEFLGNPYVQAVIGMTVAAIAIVWAYWWVVSLRDSTAENRAPASLHLTNFGEMHSRGVLSDVEFRTIKTALRGQLQDELNDTGDKG